MSDEKRKLRITVTEQRPIFSKPNGMTLYEVTAYGEDGNQIPDLRTFGDLPRSEMIDVEASAYDHPQHGRSWTIQAPSGGTAKRLGEVEARLAAAEKRITELEERFGEPKQPVHPAQQRLEDGEVKGPGFF